MNVIQNTMRHCFYSTSVNTLRNQKWDLLSAVCLERKPVITKDMNDIEVRYSKMLAQIEFENSYKNDHEMRKEGDKLRAELLKHKSTDIDLDQVMIQTAQDFEDANIDEFNKFTFASRITEADKNGNVNSVERILQDHLLLLVQQKLGDTKFWAMPQGLRFDGETMLQTAERVLQDTCGSKLKVHFYGNAPCGVHKYKYPKKFVDTTKNSAVGAKVFFFKACLMAGNVETEKLDLKSFKWLGRNELEKHLSPEYYKTICQFLIDNY
ncbi:39S ribosomal protein L46 [Blattella germanica]|nr:39S ribosomal protein L46 [Blattella germanica]